MTPEKEAMLSVYREKWKNFSLSTERLNPQKAIAAARTYCIAFGLNWRDIRICDSPYAALMCFKQLPSNQPNDWYISSLERMNQWHIKITDVFECCAQLDKLNEYPTEEDRLRLYLHLNCGFELTDLVTAIQSPIYKKLEVDLGHCGNWINLIGLDTVASRFLVDFYTCILNWRFEWKEASAAYRLLGNASDWILHNGHTCIVCERPIKLLLNSENQPHAQGEPAILFADGFSVYV